MSTDVLAYRLEYGDKGPFWCDKTFRQLVRQCRRVTPQWIQDTVAEHWSSFIEYYCAHADSPYDEKAFDYFLSRPAQDPNWRFGFTQKQSFSKELGFEQCGLYRDQFESLLDKDAAFNIRVYLVRPLAASRDEVLFDARRAELIDEATTWSAFERL
jgi:hypothetical protein